ncbi:MAG: hypothetical protein KDD62_05940, partial [Bdellovibrionales bacterium]|nr:hypothetical protein [Bdellovibrionales bacterium]
MRQNPEEHRITARPSRQPEDLPQAQVETTPEPNTLSTTFSSTPRNIARNFRAILDKISFTSAQLTAQLIEGKKTDRRQTPKSAFQKEVARVDTAKKIADEFHREACPELKFKRTLATAYVGMQKALLPITVGLFLTGTAPTSSVWFGAMIALVVATPLVEAYRNNYANRMGEISFFGERAALVARYHDFTFKELSKSEVIDEL